MAGFRGALTAVVMVVVVATASNAARAELSGEMQGAIADMVNGAIAAEDAKGLGAAIDDLCAAHPDIKEEIVAAVAAELAARRPPGFCAGRIGPCLDLDSVMDTLLSNILVTYNTASRGRSGSGQRILPTEDNTAECGNGDCSLRLRGTDSEAVEPPPSSSPSPVDW